MKKIPWGRVRTVSSPGVVVSGRTSNPRTLLYSLGLKFTLFTFTLIALAIFLVAHSVTTIMDDAILQSLIQRGVSVTETVSGPASFSILSEDGLALDNLASRIVSSQSEISYLAILDHEHHVLAHNQLALTGDRFPFLSGKTISEFGAMSVSKISRNGEEVFEFRNPVTFSDKKIGEVIVGLGAQSLEMNRTIAHQKITYSALGVLALGIIGALLLARFFSRPIERLNDAVSRVKKGETDINLQVTSRDELGTLTRNFNDMARVIRVQKDNLVYYASDLEDSYNAIVRTLAGALDARDNYTYGHSARVATLAAGIGRRLDFGHEEIKELEMACLLHDIGKIRVPDHILNKEDKLDEHELGSIQQHPVYGAQILELADSLHKYIPAVLSHHEYFDGSGYPDGLQGESIPLQAQIISLADAYDAMTTSRPYRPGRSREAAISEIRAFKGRQFAPVLAELFIDSLEDYDDTAEMVVLDTAACS